MHIRPATATSMLQRMERDGWITRSRDADDQRVARISLTAKAKTLRAEGRKVLQRMDSELTAVYTPEEQATLRRLLMKLHERFVAGVSSPPYGSDQDRGGAG